MSIRRTVAVAWLYAPFAVASAAPPDTVVVTAARTPLALTEVGATVTVIDRAEIERRQSRYVTELLRGVPGFSVSSSGGIGAQSQLRVRGAEANHLLVLIDGLQINDPASGDEMRLELLSSADVERIEIVHGPQSALWGSDAIGAVVNIITRDAGPQSAMNLRGEIGGDTTRNAGARVAGRLGSWGVSLAAERLDTVGINIARDGDERDGATLQTVGFNARYSGDDRLTFDVGLRYADSESQFDPVDFIVTGLPIDGDRVGLAERFYASAALGYRADGGRLTHRIRAGWLDTDNDSLSDGVSSGESGAERLSLGYQLDVAIGSDTLSLAVDHDDSDFRQSGAVVFADPNQRQSMQSTGYGIEYIGRAFDPLTWSLSARLDDNSDFDDATSARAMLAWNLSDTTTVRASIAEGRKNPTFTERFGFFPDLFFGNPALRPESSVAYELGLERRLLNDALNVDIAIFRQVLEDEIDGFVFDPATFLFTAGNRDGSSERRGGEMRLTAALGNAVQLRVGYSYLDATEPSASGGRADEIRRPRHQGHVGIDATVWDNRLTLALAGDYGGSRLDRFFPPFPEPARDVVLASYWVFDLSTRFELHPAFAVTARVTNLLDEQYEQVLGYSTPGRTIYVGFETGFGLAGANR